MPPPHPPLTTPLSTAIIHDDTMPAALFRSYARLYAAAWESGYRQTPPLEFDRQLIPLLGVRRAQAREQLRVLRFARLLDWSSNGGNYYVIRFPDGEETAGLNAGAGRVGAGLRPAPTQGEASDFPDDVVGDVDPLNSESESIHQQQTQSGFPDSPAEIDEQARGYLLAAGVWPDVSLRLAERIASNERRTQVQGDQHYLPVLADVLGWMAYCFAERKKNNIGAPAAVLAANLNANRRCPDEYRPQMICAACCLEQDYCDCEQPELHFPDDFLERAFRGRSPYEFNRTWWGVCTLCRGYPCQC